MATNIMETFRADLLGVRVVQPPLDISSKPPEEPPTPQEKSNPPECPFLWRLLFYPYYENVLFY